MVPSTGTRKAPSLSPSRTASVRGPARTLLRLAGNGPEIVKVGPDRDLALAPLRPAGHLERRSLNGSRTRTMKRTRRGGNGGRAGGMNRAGATRRRKGKRTRTSLSGQRGPIARTGQIGRGKRNGKGKRTGIERGIGKGTRKGTGIGTGRTGSVNPGRARESKKRRGQRGSERMGRCLPGLDPVDGVTKRRVGIEHAHMCFQCDSGVSLPL